MSPEFKTFKKIQVFFNCRYRGFHPNELFGENEKLSFNNPILRKTKPSRLFRVGKFPQYFERLYGQAPLIIHVSFSNAQKKCGE